ncbi:zinc finger protein 41 homolog [Elephas maximus indicus]|uniref:zinc finger protein 41 homolog n=1 Tax=Elephas maximus indicus TaxID=99487 RepID=UPI0021165BCD|nr:zinc finger protein 41 homolog [Elephas maximus indicus]
MDLVLSVGGETTPLVEESRVTKKDICKTEELWHGTSQQSRAAGPLPSLASLGSFLSWEPRKTEEPTGKIKKMQTLKEKADVPKDTLFRRESVRGKKPSESCTLAGKQSEEPGLSPEDEERLFDAFNVSFKDDFEGVPMFVPFQRKKPYGCGKCGYVSRHNTDHIQHQCVRTGEKPFQCSQCRKTFWHSSDVTKHWHVHGGEALQV